VPALPLLARPVTGLAALSAAGLSSDIAILPEWAVLTRDYAP
jgi:hypothetical protein